MLRRHFENFQQYKYHRKPSLFDEYEDEGNKYLLLDKSISTVKVTKLMSKIRMRH